MKILVVGMCDSVHTVRWISQFKGTNISFQLFPSTPHRRLHPGLRSLLNEKQKPFVFMRGTDRRTALLFGIMDLLIGRRLQAHRIRKLVQSEAFDLIHLFETQHAGYLFEVVTRKMRVAIPVGLSVWGSDFHWYGREVQHRTLISRSLRTIDFLFVEGARDESLARNYGFVGLSSKPISAGGGVGSVETLSLRPSQIPPSRRKQIVVKGYSGRVGRASVSLKAVLALQDLLGEYQIHVYSCSYWMTIRILVLRVRSNLKIYSYRKKTLSHDEILELFLHSRVSLSLMMSDGLPGSFREAVWTGAFPIESIGSCINEWVDDECQVRLVNPDNFSSVVNALSVALTDSRMVDMAHVANTELAKTLSIESVRNQALQEYERFGKMMKVRS